MKLHEVFEKLTETMKEDLREDAAKATKFFKSLSVVNTLFLIILAGCAAWFSVKVLRELSSHSTTMVKQESNIELLMKNVQVMNEPAVLLKIIREKAPNMPAETQARAVDAIFRTCAARNIPLPVACGLAETESSFNPNIQDSSAGAVSWFQVMISSAKPYMNFLMGGYSLVRLREPVTNAICGINILGDLRDAELEIGRSPEQAMRIALGHYNCGNIILKNGFPETVLANAKIYQERFETSMKELRK